LTAHRLTLDDKRGGRRLDDLSFAVREGEILGIAGVDGNGQDELVDVLTGLRAPTSGSVEIAGQPAAEMTPRRFGHGAGAVIPADRHHTALALDLSVRDNLMMREFADPPFTRHGVLAPRAMQDRCARLVVDYDIRTPDTGVRMRQLSGGNQQKVVLARELDRRPKLLIASQPTRGLDVGATEFVYRRLLDHRAAGGATLLISTELEEILSLSDRIAVMVKGRFLRILDADEVTLELLGLLMAGEEVPG
jgi:simple sugar transport system ATP-binding protein